MLVIDRESATTERYHSYFEVPVVQEAKVAHEESVSHLQLARILQWKKLLEDKGLLTEDEQELIDCLLQAVHQENLA